MNTSHNCNRFTQNFASVCDPQPDPEIMSSLKQELKVKQYILELVMIYNVQVQSKYNENKHVDGVIYVGDINTLF